MSLPKKYSRRIRRVLGLRAVWQPGAVVDLGDVVTLRRGVFVPVEALSDFGVSFRRKRGKASQLTLSAQGVTETLVQAGDEVRDLSDLEPNTQARLEIRFASSNSYHLRTPKMSSTAMDDLAAVGRAVAKLGDWLGLRTQLHRLESAQRRTVHVPRKPPAESKRRFHRERKRAGQALDHRSPGGRQENVRTETGSGNRRPGGTDRHRGDAHSPRRQAARRLISKRCSTVRSRR